MGIQTVWMYSKAITRYHTAQLRCRLPNDRIIRQILQMDSTVQHRVFTILSTVNHAFPYTKMSPNSPSDTELNDDTIRQTVYNGIRKAILWMVGVVLFLGLLSHNLRQESWNVPLSSINWPLLCVGWGFMVGTMWILGLRWRVLLKDTTASRSFFGASLSAGLLINYALPGPMGELMGGWLLKREDNTPIVTGLTASTLARLIGLFTAAIGSVILWWWVNIELSFAKTALQVLILGIGGGGLLLIGLSFNADKIAVRMQDKEDHHPLKLVGNSLLQIQQLSIRQFAQAMIFSTLGHGTAFMGVWISLIAIGGSPSPVDIAFVYLVGTCSGTVAFLFPGSQLTWDAIFIGLLISVSGYDAGGATIATGILRVEQIAMMLFGAGPLFWILSRQQRQ